MCLSKEVLDSAEQMVQVAPWWIMIEGASWKHPEGPKEHIFQNINTLSSADFFIN